MPKFVPEPRIWKAAQVAARLNVHTKTFHRRRTGLESLGFPIKDDVLGGWHGAAIDEWLDRRASVGKTHPSAPGAIGQGDEIAEMIANAGKDAA